MGNLASCVSKKVEKDGLDLMQTLFHEMEKRLMDCIKAELTQSRSQGSNVSGADIDLPPPPPLLRQSRQVSQTHQ